MNDLNLERLQSAPFLTVPELASLLHLNEKKIYQLAGDGAIPGTKITGKWIFPRRLVEDWIVENSCGGVLSDRLILVGSDDQLVNRVAQETAIRLQQSALISYSPCGTRHGLRMLDGQKADACFINWGASEEHARRHQGLLRTYRNHPSWVVVRCLERQQGLILGRALDQGRQHSAAHLLADHSLQWAMRQDDSGAERLLTDACHQHDVRLEDLNASTVCHSERSAAAAVSRGQSDITCGVESTAVEYDLPFVPLARVAIDLVTTRRTYFRTLLQQLLEQLRDPQTHQIANTLTGYNLPPEQKVFSMD